MGDEIGFAGKSAEGLMLDSYPVDTCSNGNEEISYKNKTESMHEFDMMTYGRWDVTEQLYGKFY